jgi:hypothetical protein
MMSLLKITLTVVLQSTYPYYVHRGQPQPHEPLASRLSREELMALADTVYAQLEQR